MRQIRSTVRRSALAITASLLGLTLTGVGSSAAQSPNGPTRAMPTIVLVHGAWADGSSWAAVTTRLQRQGFTVDVVPNPLRGVASDAQYLRNHLSTLSGPVVLVGHSYGGMVITDAASGNANVRALVYVDAYIPQQGESVEQLTAAQPGSELDPDSAINAVPLQDPAGDVQDVDLYVAPRLFPALFAAGAPATVAEGLAADQRPLTLSALTEALPGVPAWQSIPSWALIGTADRVLPPAEQQVMADRAHAHVTRVDAPHLAMITDPDAVTGLIAAAAGRR
jgi:pimeloyl-ACP methyl ester carboxylesterase